MKKIVVMSQQDAALAEALSVPEGMELRFSESAGVLPDTACVLISQCFAGTRLAETAADLRRRNIPFAVVTFDRSDENEAALLDAGVTQIIKLPMSELLLKKRISALIHAAEPGGSDAGFALFSQLAEGDSQRGAYAVRESDFTNIYKFVLRLQERMDKQAQLVRFTFHTRLKMPLEPGTLEAAFPIVQKCLRRGDIASMHSEGIYAILMGADEEGGKIAADRIVTTYEAHVRDSIYTMKYEMQEIR